MTAEHFHYRAFGLDIDSELQIAQLQLCELLSDRSGSQTQCSSSEKLIRH